MYHCFNMQIQKLTFGELLRLKRLREGQKLCDLAVKIGVTPSAVSRWEKKFISWKHLSHDRLEKIASALNCTTDELKNE